MNKETLILVIQELKVLKGNLIVASAIGASEAGIIQLAVESMSSMLKEEKVEERELLNDDFVDLCYFLLMEANDNHIEALRHAFDYRYANLISEVKFYNEGGVAAKELHQHLECLEDIRSLLPPPTIKTPSSKDLFEQIRGGKEDG